MVVLSLDKCLALHLWIAFVSAHIHVCTCWHARTLCGFRGKFSFNPPPISVKNISHEVNSYKRKILLLILQMFGFPDGGHIALDIILNMLRGVRIIFVC